MNALLKKIKQTEKGAIAVEFALVFPIVLLLSFGFFEFCRVVFVQNVLDYSTGQAARFAMISFDDASDDATYLEDRKTAIKAHAYETLDLLDSNNITTFDVTIGALDSSNGTRNVAIKIQYNFATYIPMLSSIDLTLTSEKKSFLAQGF